MAGARLASRPNRRALRSVPGETPRIPPQPRMPRAGHRDRSTASIDHRHRKIPPAFASNHLRSIRHYNQKGRELARFLEASRFPNMGFVSTSVEKRDEHLARVTGDLTMLGVTRPISLDVEVAGKLAGTNQRVGFKATGVINRLDFGMNSHGSCLCDARPWSNHGARRSRHRRKIRSLPAA